jgi:hypothetical protein
MTRLAMNLAVRTVVPVRVTSVTSTMPRPVLTSTRRPARVDHDLYAVPLHGTLPAGHARP